MIGVATVSYMSIGIKDDKVHGIKDYILIWTEPLNSYFREDLSRRNVLLIVCSALLDLLILTGFYRFARYATTWRMVIALVLFYALRSIC